MEEKSKVEILDEWETKIGVFVRIKTDYGVETQLNFAKPITDEEITRQIRQFYESNLPANQPARSMKKGMKVNW